MTDLKLLQTEIQTRLSNCQTYKTLTLADLQDPHTGRLTDCLSCRLTKLPDRQTKTRADMAQTHGPPRSV